MAKPFLELVPDLNHGVELASSFDPAAHPRGILGRFVAKLDALPDGGRVMLPTPVAVRSSRGPGFDVTIGGGPRQRKLHVESASAAAKTALKAHRELKKRERLVPAVDGKAAAFTRALGLHVPMKAVYQLSNGTLEDLSRPVELAADSLLKASTPEPFSTSRTSNWVARRGGLPSYIQHIAHDLIEKRGMTESRAIATAIAIVKRWAAGAGNVDANTRAAATKAVMEWEALKARNGAKLSATGGSFVELAGAGAAVSGTGKGAQQTSKQGQQQSSSGGDFNSKHPRSPAGSPSGGKFAKKDSGGGQEADFLGWGQKGAKKKTAAAKKKKAADQKRGTGKKPAAAKRSAHAKTPTAAKGQRKGKALTALSHAERHRLLVKLDAKLKAEGVSPRERLKVVKAAAHRLELAAMKPKERIAARELDRAQATAARDKQRATKVAARDAAKAQRAAQATARRLAAHR